MNWRGSSCSQRSHLHSCTVAQMHRCTDDALSHRTRGHSKQSSQLHCVTVPASCLLAEFYIQPTHKGAKEIHIKKHVKRISFWLDEIDDLMKNANLSLLLTLGYLLKVLLAKCQEVTCCRSGESKLQIVCGNICTWICENKWETPDYTLLRSAIKETGKPEAPSCHSSTVKLCDIVSYLEDIFCSFTVQ